MLGQRRLFVALAVATAAFHPLQQHAVKAHRSDDLALDVADDDEATAVSGDSLAVVAVHNQSAALVQTAFFDPLTLTVLSGISAAGSLYAIGKTIREARRRNREKKDIARVITQYQEQTVAGCKMLDHAGSFLAQKLDDLDILYNSMDDLKQVCGGERGSSKMTSYLAFLKARLEDTCQKSPQVLKAKCKEVFTDKFAENVNEACDMSAAWGTTEGLENAKMEVYKHVWQMDGLKRGICGSGLTGAGASVGLIEEGQVRSGSGFGVVLDSLGLAFTLCGWADMLVTIGDHAISEIWGNGVQGLLAFTEHKAQLSQAAVCNTFTDIWLKSFVPGQAAKLANLGMRMLKERLDDATVQEHLARLSDNPFKADVSAWGLKEETVYLCHHGKQCLTPMPKDWEEKTATGDVGGLIHPQSSCFKQRRVTKEPDDERLDDLQLVRVCDGAGAYVNALPQACFRAYKVVNSNKLTGVKIGSNKDHQVFGSSFAYEFSPRMLGNIFFAKEVFVHAEMDREACEQPLQGGFWSTDLSISTSNLADACPSG